jgi:Flp pilus assembly protein CpaB
MKRRSGLIWIATGVVLAVLAGLLAISVIFRASESVAPPAQERAEVDVVVAARFIAVRELIQSSDVEMKAVPVDVVPVDAAYSVVQVAGQMAVTPFSPGQMILISQVVSPTIKGEHLGFLLEEGQVAMAYPPVDLMSNIGVLQPGDHIDLLFSLGISVEAEGGVVGGVAEEGVAEGGTEELVTFYTLQNVELLTFVHAAAQTREDGTTIPGGPVALVLALDPQGALILKHLKDRGSAILDIVLRAPEDEELFDTQPVHMDYLIDRYQLRIPVLP